MDTLTVKFLSKYFTFNLNLTLPQKRTHIHTQIHAYVYILLRNRRFKNFLITISLITFFFLGFG